MSSWLSCVTPECPGLRPARILFCLDCATVVPAKLRQEISVLTDEMESELSQARYPGLRAHRAARLEIARRIRGLKDTQPSDYHHAKGR